MNDNTQFVRFPLPHDPERAELYSITPEPYDLNREEIRTDLYRRVEAALYRTVRADLFRAEPDLDNISCARMDDLLYEARCIVVDILANTPPWELTNSLPAQPDDDSTHEPPNHESNEVNP